MYDIKKCAHGHAWYGRCVRVRACRCLHELLAVRHAGSFRVDRSRCIEGRCLHQIMSAKTKVTKTKTALKQETYNLSDLNFNGPET